jgi:hypothetical protein
MDIIRVVDKNAQEGRGSSPKDPPPFFDGQHLDQVLGSDKENYLLIFAINAVSPYVRGSIRKSVTAHNGQSTHGFGKIIQCLINFLFSDLVCVVVLEFDQNQARAQLSIKMPPVVAEFQVPIRENGVAAIDSGV